MNAATVTFLLIGGTGLVLLIASLFLGDLDADADAGPFSLPSVAGFVGAFGLGGAIPAAIGTVALARAASRMRTDATPTRMDVVGRLGVVVTPIPAEGYGEVRITLGGQPVKLNAKSDKPIPLGAHVFVIEAPTETSVVVEET